MGKILLFYKYVSIQYPKRVLKWQKQICDNLGLKGRILLAHEGINGTVGGDSESIDRYREIMLAHELFGDIDFKESYGAADYFTRMEIKVKEEVVHMGVDPQKLTTKTGGKHLTPEQTHALLKNKSEDVVILDARNNYESRIGAFEGAIKPDIKNFRDFPEYIDNNLEKLKDKKVLMYCTGGIRCERATAYLNEKKVAKEVMQIEGGIVRYAEQYPDGFFRGKNYVFDRRVAIPITDDVLSSCDICNVPCDEYTNCINARCNIHYISCADCVGKMQNTCSSECKALVQQGKVATRVPFVNAPIVPDQR